MGALRGEGDSISIQRAIAKDSVDIDPSTSTVRYPTLMSSDRPIAYDTESFDSWADRKCASIGSEVVLSTIQERFETEVRGIMKGVGAGDTSEDLGTVITVWATTHRNRDGKIRSEPNVSFEALVERTPRAVHATITLEDREHTRSVPVFVEKQEIGDL